jgi:LysM repeat protein
MRKIALAAVALALLLTGSSLHMASAQATQHSKDKPAHTIAQTSKPVEQQPAAPAPAPAPAPVVVTVASGDTLSGIAADNSTTYMRLYDANDFINNPDLIYPGDQVAVPTSDEQLADRAVPVAPAPEAAPAAAPVEDTQAAPEAPAVESAPEVAPAPAPAVEEAPAPAPVVTTGTPDNAAKAFIYAHESSNNPDATNYLGCYGLGQDCNGQVRGLCGADYACQDEFFTNYAMRRYGSWENAQAFWIAHNWW